MSRRLILERLRRYRERWPAESATVARLAEFVGRHENCFSRSLLVGHVTGSAWLVDGSGENVLLTCHRKLGRWLQLGGHSDGDPDTLAVALREAVEESGIAAIEPVSEDIFDVDIHVIPERAAEPAHEHHDLRFALRVVGEHDFVVSEESHALAWVPIDDIRRYTDEASVLRMARKWLSRT